MRTVYAVTGNSDKIEGRGSQMVICLTEDRGLAARICEGKTYAKHYGGMAQPGTERDVREYQLIESEEDFEKLALSR